MLDLCTHLEPATEIFPYTNFLKYLPDMLMPLIQSGKLIGVKDKAIGALAIEKVFPIF